MTFKTTRWLGMCLTFLTTLLLSSAAIAQSNCSNPTAIAAVPYASGSLTTCGAVGDFAAGFSCTSSNYGGGEDYVFSFTAPATESYLLELGGSTTYKVISVHTACPPTTTNCVGGGVTSFNSSTAYTLAATGGTTYTLVVDTWPLPACGDFTLDISVAPNPPGNDECAGATGIILDAPATSGTVAAATDSGIGICSGTDDDDVWYSFVAPAGGAVNIELTNVAGSTTDMYHTVLDGACGSQTTSLTCSDGDASNTTGLTPGATYYVQVYTWSSTGNQTSTFDISITTPPAPPANDDCAGATPVTLGAAGVCGPTITATNTSATGTAGDVCNSTSTSYGDGDIWFSFVAGGPTAVLDLSSTVGSLYMSVYADCAGTCVYNNNFLSTSSNEIITGLTAGETYLIRMYESGNNAFGTIEFCMSTPPPPPANDICSGAIPATVGANGTCPAGSGAYSEDFTYVSETTSYSDYASCDLSGNWDLWYTWVATAASIEFTDGTGDPGLAVYAGTCGALTELGCLNNVSGTIGGLTVGETYFLHVWDDTQGASTVEWCWQAGPACADPTSLAASNLAETSADVTFNALAAGGHTVEYGATGFTLGAGTTVAVPTGGMAALTGLTALTGYDVYVTANCGGADVGPVSFTTLGPPPANDDCANATPVTLGVGSCGTTVTATNVDATGTAGDVCGSTSSSYGAGDIWFSFEAGTETVFLDLTTTVGSLYMSVYDACGGSCVYNNNFLSTSTDEVISGLTPGNTYLIRMYESGNNTFGAIEFCMYNNSPPPANDMCANAEALTVAAGLANCSFTTGTNAGATSSGLSPGCASYSGGDVWYSAVVPASGEITVTSETNGGITDSGMAIYDACGGTVIECDDDDSPDGAMSEITLTGRTPGETLYIAMWEYGNNGFGTFGMCAYDANPPTALTVAPAAGCSGTVTETVDGSGTPAVIDFIDGAGDIYASIANTQALGSVAVSLYGAASRQTAAGDFYLNRNVAIVPTTQPTAAMDVTIYVLDSEVTALINASQTAGTPIASVNDLQFAKVAGTASCTAAYPGGADPVGLAASPYGTDWAFSGSVTSFSEFFVLASAAPLPVELSSFTAYATDAGNRVEWTAAIEEDFYMYTVERATDPASFTAFADVAPKGTEYAEAVYASMDRTPATTTYYRLRMEDLDGTIAYSDVVAVTREDDRGGVSIFPNPAHDKVTFDITPSADPSNVNIALTDLSGRVVREWNLAPGQRTDVSISNIPSGVYMVTTVRATGIQSQRLVIE